MSKGPWKRFMGGCWMKPEPTWGGRRGAGEEAGAWVCEGGSRERERGAKSTEVWESRRADGLTMFGFSIRIVSCRLGWLGGIWKD